ncbi:hypothetical protein LBMAG27_02380 [Bacteroidota bacterium]|nr:hypothetical protein LBMAG27_02380 [Bacteroidota bacterium]
MIFIISLNTSAQDRVFTNTYQTNVLPSGVKDLEYQVKWNTGRSNFYNSLEQRVEFEVGLGKNIQTSLYLNFNSKTLLDETSKQIIHDNSFGFSSEFKWKLSDPTINKIGSALYAEIGTNGEEWELEGKLLLDKQINNNLFALNIAEETEMEFVFENDKVKKVMEYPVNINLGWMYSISNHIGIGIEAKNFNDISPDEGWESSLLFAGPAFNFNGDGWYINLSCMPQIRNLKMTKEFPQNMDLSEHERFESRVLLSFNL